MKTIIIPKENEKDLKEIPSKILKDFKVVLADHMDDVLKNALSLKDPDQLFKRKNVDPLAPEEPTYPTPPPVEGKVERPITH